MNANNLYNKLYQFYDGRDILGIFSFGSNVEFKNLNENTDIDLLIIVREKNYLIKSKIDSLFDGEYTIIHHPDFYSKRNSLLPIIEIIVLPIHSKFFNIESKGILTGISGFIDNPYVKIRSISNLDHLIQLPSNQYTLEQRINIMRNSDWGIVDYLTKIWPLLNKDVEEIDWNRVIKFLIMDLNWVLDGKMIRYRKTVLNKNKVENQCLSVYASIDQLMEIQNMPSKLTQVKELFKILNDLNKCFRNFSFSNMV